MSKIVIGSYYPEQQKFCNTSWGILRWEFIKENLGPEFVNSSAGISGWIDLQIDIRMRGGLHIWSMYKKIFFWLCKMILFSWKKQSAIIKKSPKFYHILSKLVKVKGKKARNGVGQRWCGCECAVPAFFYCFIYSTFLAILTLKKSKEPLILWSTNLVVSYPNNFFFKFNVTTNQ